MSNQHFKIYAVVIKMKKVVMEEKFRKLVIDHNKEGDLIIRFYEPEIKKK